MHSYQVKSPTNTDTPDEREGQAWTDGTSAAVLDADLLRDMPQHTYTAQDRMAAAMVWAVTGNAREVERRAGVDQATVSWWVRESPEWWVGLVSKCLAMKSRELDARLTGIMDDAIDATLDRLRNGDAVVYKGEVIRKPVSALQAATIMGIAFDKRQMGRGLATSRVERVDLGALRAKFARVIDGEKATDIGGNGNANPHTPDDSST